VEAVINGPFSFDGDLYMENTKDQSVKRLGEHLKYDPKLIAKALSSQPEETNTPQRKPLDQILVEAGAVTPDALRKAILDQRLDRLAGNTIFSELTPHELAALGKWASEVSIPEDQEFITQDTEGECFYVLINGRLKVYRKGEYGEEIFLAYVEPGESIGEMGFFTDGYRSASVKTLSESQLLKIKYQDLQKIIDQVPTLVRNFLGVMAERLYRTDYQFQEIAVSKELTERSLKGLSKLMDTSQIMTVRAGIEGLIQRVVTVASEVMDSERASLFLLDHVNGELWSKVAMGMGTEEIRIPVGQGVAGWAAQHNESVNIEDAYEDSRFDESVDRETGFRTRTILCAPIRNLMGQPIGVIQVINKKGGVFGPEDERIFSIFAHQAAMAVENFRLFQKVTTYHERMGILLDVTTSVAQTLDLDALIFKIVEKISQALNAERSTLFLVDSKTNELWSKFAEGVEVVEIRFPRTLGLAGLCATTGRILNVKDAYRDSRFYPEVDSQTGFRTRTVLSAPILNRGGDVIGVTQALNKRGGIFDDEDEDLLESLASQLAIALENAQLYENVKSHSEKLQETLTKLEMLEKVKAHLLKFVPFSVAELIERDPEELDLEKVPMDVSILFIDIEGFSAITEGYDQMLVNDMVERHFSSYLECIRRYDGEIIETSGDGLMIIFKGGTFEELNRNAVATAMDIIAENRHLNREVRFPWGPVHLHLGVNSGEAWVGSTKMKSLSGERWVYTASGLVTVLAARIGSLSHESRLYVGPETHACLGPSYVSECIGPHELKNIKKPLLIYHIKQPL
jgi:GAF domain-containing protein